MIDMIQRFDVQILEFIQVHVQNNVLDKFFSFATQLGDNGLIWIAISLFLLISKKNRKVGIMVILALTLALIVNEGLLKNLVQRPRPFITYPEFNWITYKPSGYSFPSSHAATSFAAAGILAKKLKRYKVIFWALALSISLSRIYLLVHYPSDLIVGMMIGMSCSWIVLKAFKFRDSRI